MLSRTKLAIAAALLASSASGALAQSQIGNGVPAELVQPGATYYMAVRHKGAPPRYVRAPAPTYANEVPFAPF